MPKINLDLGSIRDPENPHETADHREISPEAVELANALPSPYHSELRAKLRKRTQMNFPRVPEFVKDQFDRAAKARKMTKIEFFYHCLREGGGLEIPPYDQMDLRKT